MDVLLRVLVTIRIKESRKRRRTDGGKEYQKEKKEAISRKHQKMAV